MSTAPAIRAYLGGSFNPVHHSHIQMAMYVYQCLAPIAAAQQRPLHVSLLPNARSPFKEQSLDPAHRLAMLMLAIADTPLQISELELWQTPPVYSIDSVSTLHERYPNDSLIFIMGMDSARSLDKWKNGLQLTDYVHLWIFDRSYSTDLSPITDIDPKINIEVHTGINTENKRSQNLSAQAIAHLTTELPSALQGQMTDHLTDLTQAVNALSAANICLQNTSRGRIYIDPRPVTALSSTQIRKQLYLETINTAIANNQSNLLAKCLNPTVYQYIIAHQLYYAV